LKTSSLGKGISRPNLGWKKGISTIDPQGGKEKEGNGGPNRGNPYEKLNKTQKFKIQGDERNTGVFRYPEKKRGIIH